MTLISASSLASGEEGGQARTPGVPISHGEPSLNQFGEPCIPVKPTAAEKEEKPAKPEPKPPRRIRYRPLAPQRPELPEPEARVRIAAPAARGLWAFRLDNEGERTLRVAADIRLLRFEIERGRKRPIVCELPSAMRPRNFPKERELYLGPGQSYIELFDPELFCFGEGESEALEGGAVIRPFYGWAKPRFARRWPRGTPVVIEGLEFPSEVEPLHMIAAPTMQLSHAPPPSMLWIEPVSGEGELAFDEKAPRLGVRAARFVEAYSPHTAALRVTITNEGHRPMLVALRRSMIGFYLNGPDGMSRCEPEPPSYAMPRDSFRTLRAGASERMTVLINEACAEEPLKRPGLYRIVPILYANATGDSAGLEAHTGVAVAEAETLLRLATGSEPFYWTPPVARMRESASLSEP